MSASGTSPNLAPIAFDGDRPDLLGLRLRVPREPGREGREEDLEGVQAVHVRGHRDDRDHAPPQACSGGVGGVVADDDDRPELVRLRATHGLEVDRVHLAAAGVEEGAMASLPIAPYRPGGSPDRLDPMDDERWEPGMPVLDRQAVPAGARRTSHLPPSLQGLPPRSVPETRPTPLQKHYVLLSAPVLIAGRDRDHRPGARGRARQPARQAVRADRGAAAARDDGGRRPPDLALGLGVDAGRPRQGPVPPRLVVAGRRVLRAGGARVAVDRWSSGADRWNAA